MRAAILVHKIMDLALSILAGVYRSIGTDESRSDGPQIREQVQYLLEHHRQPKFSWTRPNDVNEKR